MALAPLIVSVVLAARRADATALRVFTLGLTTGSLYFAGTLYWVVEVMRGYGGLPGPVALLVGLLLAAYLALYPALFALLLRDGVRRFGPTAIWLAPLFWVASEWLRSTIGGGFPWVLLGASQANVIPIVQFASLAGVYGLSALVALVGTAAAILTLSPTARPGRGPITVAVVVLVVAGWGAWRVHDATLMREGDATRVGLVQGSVAQEDKYDPARRVEIINRYLTLSRQVLGARADLVIWPEAATPFYFDIDSALAQPVRKLAAEARTPFVIGTDELDRGSDGRADRYYNAAVLVGSDGRTQGSYRKQYLVPFGEYVPLKKLLFFVGPLIEAVSDFSPGMEAVVFNAGGRRVSVAICYESVYPSVARAFVNHGSELLVTITNDAWFGRSSAPYQHFAQGALRAVEEGRFVVRAANTGISGAVDPYGRVLATTPLFEPAAITVDVRLLRSRTLYGRTGDLIAWVSLSASALLVVTRPRRRRTALLPSSAKDIQA